MNLQNITTYLRNCEKNPIKQIKLQIKNYLQPENYNL